MGIAGLLIPAIKLASLLIALFLARKLRWPYPLAAAVFAVLPVLLVPTIDPLAKWLVLGEVIDMQVYMANVLWIHAWVPAAMRFVGAWLLFVVLDKYEDTVFAESLSLGIGAFILVVLI